MPFDNPRFAEQGETPGEPRAWRVTSLVGGQRKVGFGPAPFEGVESFERWSELVVRLGLVEQVFFDPRPEGYEDFAEGWGVDSYVVDFSNVPAAVALFGSEPVDAFLAGWDVERFGWSLDDVDVESAGFLDQDAEGFERGHRNDTYRWRFGIADLVRASLGVGGAETFETTWPEHDERGGGHGGEH
jgi:hypothetical protein